MLSEFIKLPNRPDRDRSATIGASEIGKCARMLAHSRAGTEPDFEYEGSGYAERGHHMEKWWVARLRESPIGHKIKKAGNHQETLHYGPISATPDALFDRAWSADCKSKDPRISRLPKDEHVIQVRLTAKIAMELGLISKNGGGVLNYIDASNYADIEEFTLPPYDDETLQSLVARAHEILSSEPNDLPREGWIGGGKECQDCPFRTACLGEKIEQVNELPEDTLSRVMELHTAGLDAKERAKQAENEERAALDEILQIFRKHKTRSVKGVAFIRRGTSAGKLDTEALEADGIDLSLYRTDGTPWESITLQKPKQKQEQ